MNLTIIDIPGITVNVTPINQEDSTDMAYLVELKDEKGNKVVVSICYGNIVKTESKVK